MVYIQVNKNLFRREVIRLCIGDQDPMVQLKWARLTEQAVKSMGFKQYTFKEYHNMGHSSCDQVNLFMINCHCILFKL